MRKSEEKTDAKRTVIKTMEEYNNDNSAPAEDVIIMIQVPQSKWDKDDFESEEEDVTSTQPVPSVGKPTSVVKNVGTKAANTGKYAERESEPAEKVPRPPKDASHDVAQPEVRSSKTSASSEKGKSKDRDHCALEKENPEKRKSSGQPEKEANPERPGEQGASRSLPQPGKESRTPNKHDSSRGLSHKDFTPGRDRKADCDDRAHAGSKRRDERGEQAGRRDSPPRGRDPAPGQKARPREDRDGPKKGTGDSRKGSSSPSRDKKPHDHKATHDARRPGEETKPADKNPGQEREKHAAEARTSREPGGTKSPYVPHPPEPQADKEQAAGQSDKTAAKPKPQPSHSSRLSSDLTRETDEAAFEPDYNESDSESNVSVREENAAEKTAKEPREKATEKARESADPAAAGQPGAPRSHSQSSPSASPSRSHSPSGSQTRSRSSSASSAETQDSKKKKKKRNVGSKGVHLNFCITERVWLGRRGYRESLN